MTQRFRDQGNDRHKKIAKKKKEKNRKRADRYRKQK